MFINGDMFHVVDTLPEGVRTAWRAFKVDQYGKETEYGLIPTEQRYHGYNKNGTYSHPLPLPPPPPQFLLFLPPQS